MLYRKELGVRQEQEHSLLAYLRTNCFQQQVVQLQALQEQVQ